jgi:hypothetical protein
LAQYKHKKEFTDAFDFLDEKCRLAPLIFGYARALKRLNKKPSHKFKTF